MTLVLLHPVGLDSGCWDLAASQLPADAVRHELPGFGARPRRTPVATVQDLADDVAESCPGMLDVVGVSFGGMVGQHLAVRHPDRVRSLLVACTGASTNAEAMLGRAAAVEHGGMEGVLQSTLDRWFTAAALAARPEHPGVAYARRTLAALDPAAFADGWRTIAGHDALDGLRGVTARVTALAGAHDVSAPVERVRQVADLVPGARLIVLDAPHMVHLERPQEFAAAVREHLDWGGGR
jgi:3-oxoadipate enol-lactonase